MKSKMSRFSDVSTEKTNQYNLHVSEEISTMSFSKSLNLKGIGSFYHSPRVKQLSFTIFESIQPFFFIFRRRISVTRQFLVSLTSIVFFFPTMEVNETKNWLLIFF